MNEGGESGRAHFGATSRILPPGVGALGRSAEHFDMPADSRGQAAYDVPLHIPAREEAAAAAKVDRETGPDRRPDRPKEIVSANFTDRN